MKIYTDLKDFSAINPVVTIGTFDGVHLGHRKVIRRLQELAQKVNGETVIFTFYPHPRLVLNTEDNGLRLINTLEEKKVLLEAAGIDHLVVYPFTKEFSKLTYVEFVEKILVKQLGMKYLVVGYDHRFGHNREGKYEDLKVFADQLNFKIERQDVLNMDAINVSSTKIRNAIADGDIQMANKYLGYRFFIKGDVVNGKKLGHTIGFPTANIDPQESYKLVPKDGVYAVKVDVDDKRYLGMLNIGVRPTVNNQLDNRSIEVHILDFNQDIYFKNITIHFYQRIRNEQFFASLDELKAQLAKDKLEVISLLG
ncbi:bifunctional riboflavin kinase/FAD synthetase [Labilibaculum sp. A4]|uniref:Riboflavin biosynthesis protein n=1 Tax=Labilibaculum euxinus TaxID=2686357 RepID=A0A425YCX4_9BACT|nr:bifunctional riboflavin kinase/FAD synthetase [Labilibaculum euxinus]MDQ1769935.1 bifunctional riboflavin kinase/FAD synthetase [Labilibaculum euxinus]MUP37919.1 bifunctional riboflavin kinase/FAD synthetase [Labilibaculum euxinus]MVB07124.1 bifunctional riboflavin kinase/FAD synthetase [Labilibaculum euxinus]MWN76490.1 bifunctional riboflavin kinase/FAD synthetase [Labilibaculum euxinus]